MQNYCNKPEDFFRELKGILIYDKAQISYIDQIKGKFPQPDEAKFKFSVLPGDASRKIPTKTISGNVYYQPDITISLVDLTVKNRDEWYENFNKFNQFAVVLVSNTEMMMLGNDRFPLSITVTDNLNDDGSGSDSFSLNIYGDTIIAPTVYKIVQKFLIKFFIPPVLSIP